MPSSWDQVPAGLRTPLPTFDRQSQIDGTPTPSSRPSTPRADRVPWSTERHSAPHYRMPQEAMCRVRVCWAVQPEEEGRMGPTCRYVVVLTAP
jgi:hypothetical protein